MQDGALRTLDEAHDAHDKLIEMADVLDGQQYATLPVMAKALLAQHCYRGTTVVYRALLNNILQRANSVAYGHVARYWCKRNEIAALCDTRSPLLSGLAYKEAVRMKNMRKLAFWESVNDLGQRLLIKGANASDAQA